MGNDVQTTKNRSLTSILWVLVIVISTLMTTHYVTAQSGKDWSGELNQDTVFLPEDNPHRVNENLIVPEGITLTIMPGTEVRFSSTSSLIIRGRLLAEGTPTQTLHFTWRDTGDYWREIIFDESTALNRITYAEIEYMMGIESQDSQLIFENSIIHDTDGDAIRYDGGTAILRHNQIYNVTHKDHGCEGIQINKMPIERPALILDNYIHHINDDCVDINDSTVIMERNIIHNCGDKGVSIGTNPTFPPGTRPSSVTVVNTLVYSSYYGIAVKDSAMAHITHCTLVNNEYGLALYEALDHPGLGGGLAKVINTIAWDNIKHDIYLNLENNPPPSITVSHSDIAGSWPGQGNLNTKPEFKGPVDYHLVDDSPLINMGTTTAITQDLEGNPRSIDGIPDIGAYEVQTPTFPLCARAEDQTIYLDWQIPYTIPKLHSFAIVYTYSLPGSLSIILPTTTITDIPATTSTYVLTETINYAWYTLYVEAQDIKHRELRRSPTVTAFPSNYRIYLPTTLKY